MAKKQKKNYKGLKRDKKDKRDFLLSKNLQQQIILSKKLPKWVDLQMQGTPGVPEPHYNQGQTGSCTGNAVAFAFWYRQRIQTPANDWSPSRLMIYFNARRLEGTTSSDAGAELRDAVKGIAQWGVCPETMWPFSPSKLTIIPSSVAYKAGLKHQAISYLRVHPNLRHLKACIASGNPFIFGMLVTESMEEDMVKGRIIGKPRGANLGGHAVVAISYHDDKKWFKIRNSWGAKVGDNGDFYMPYNLMTNQNFVWDIWTIRQTES